MRYLKCLMLACALLSYGSAMAEDRARAEAAKMLEVINMANVLDAAIDVSLEAQVAANPEVDLYRAVMRAFLQKHMSYSALKPQLIDIYVSEFTESELIETTAFYSTKTGQKLLEKLPALMAKGAQLGQQSIQDHIPELEAMIVEEAARIQASQNSQAERDAP